MSTLSPTPTDLRRRGSARPASRGVSGVLDVVGLVPEPASRSAANRADELMTALGLGARAIEANTRLQITREVGDRREEAAIIAREDARLAELERRARVVEAAETEQEQLDRGLAAQHAAETLPGLRERIARGELTVPEGDSVESFVADLIAEETAGETPAYTESFRDRLTPSLLSLFESQRTGLIEETRGDTLRVLANGLASGERAGQTVAAARRMVPGLTDAELFDRLISPAAKTAAESGDLERVNEILGRGPQQFAAESERIRNAAREARTRLDAVARDAVRQEAFRRLNAGEYGSAEEYLRGRLDAGEFDQDEGNVILRLIGNERERATRESLRGYADEQARAWEADVIATDAARLGSAEETGGVLSITDDATFTDAAGTEHRISESQRVDQALRARMAQIAGSGADTAQVISQQGQVLSQNGLEYKPWTSLANVGASAGMNAARRAAESGQPAPSPPPQTIAAFELYRQLRTNAPSVLPAHFKGDAELFFEMAEASLATEGVLTIGEAEGADIEKALTEAAVATLNERRVDESGLRGTVMNNATVNDWVNGSWWINPFSESSIKNPEDVTAEVFQRSRFYLSRLPSLSPEQAVSKAVESVKRSHVRSNGYLIPNRSAVHTKTIERVSEYVAGQYAEKYGEEEGVGAEDIVLAPVPGLEDQWEIRHANGGLLNHGTRFFETQFLTSRQISRLSREAVIWQREQRKAREEAIERGEIRPRFQLSEDIP